MANSNKPQVNWLQALRNSGFDPYRNEVIRTCDYPLEQLDSPTPTQKKKEKKTLPAITFTLIRFYTLLQRVFYAMMGRFVLSAQLQLCGQWLF